MCWPVGCWVGESGDPIKMQDRLFFDQIRDEEPFNFMSVYQNEFDINEEDDSPFQHYDAKCDYYEPHTFREMAKTLSNTISFFHLNCRSISANWEGIKTLLNDTQGTNFALISLV